MSSSRSSYLVVVFSCLVLTALWLAACGGSESKDEAAPEVVEQPAAESAVPAACSTSTDLPADISVAVADADQTDFDEYSWQSFLGLNASSVEGIIPTTTDADTTPLWSSWSSTVDFIENQGGTFGKHYYPEACQTATVPSGTTYSDYRPVSQVAKVNDSFDEAGDDSGTDVVTDRTQGVGLTAPLIASNGTFARYEILLNEVAFDYVSQQGFFTAASLDSSNASNIAFPAATSDDNGGDPSSAASGSIVLKLAWVDATGFDSSQFHTEDLLIYSDGSITTSGDDICELQAMALVGMHIARKTTKQPNWTWSTFEHANNAPTCDGLPPDGDGTPGNGPNTSCPTTSAAYTFNPGTPCTNGDCASCNADPSPNCSGVSSTGYCVDQTVTTGFNQICRQVTTGGTPNGTDQSTAGYGSATLNSECDGNLGGSVWANYELVSTQWTNSSGNQVPTLPVGPNGASKAYLANNTMESFERSNCLSCHNNAVISASDNSDQPHTDSMFWLAIEVAAED